MHLLLVLGPLSNKCSQLCFRMHNIFAGLMDACMYRLVELLCHLSCHALAERMRKQHPEDSAALPLRCMPSQVC